MQAIPHRKYLCFSSTPRAEQRLAETPCTCSDAAPAHLRLHQSHTCVPSHLCHVVVNLHPDMIRARLVVLLVSFRVSYVWGESLTLCRHGKDKSATLVFCVACSKDFLLPGKDLIFINQYALKLKRISLQMLLIQDLFFVCSLTLDSKGKLWRNYLSAVRQVGIYRLCCSSACYCRSRLSFFSFMFYCHACLCLPLFAHFF